VIASLPMYDFPEIRETTDAFWSALAQVLGVEGKLSRGDDWTKTWRQSELFFSQTCGYPFTHEFSGKLKYVATPHFAAEGCEGPRYSSILFARQETPLRDFKNGVAAFNNRDSMSGMLALKLVFAPFAERGAFFSQALETGGHLASLAAVQTGAADICAIDCVTVAYARRYRPEALKGLIDVGRSPSVPGLPYVTAQGDVEKLRAALSIIFSDSDLQDVREKLLLSGYSVLAAQDYNEILALEAVAEARGDLQLW
jgi:ABC-type phosphate/phosphonate transport system substrate-binding protein